MNFPVAKICMKRIVFAVRIYKSSDRRTPTKARPKKEGGEIKMIKIERDEDLHVSDCCESRKRQF